MDTSQSEENSGKSMQKLRLENEQLRNEISILKQEKREALEKYYELYRNMEKKVEERSERIREQNKLLKKEIKQRKKTEKELEDTLEEKDELLHEVHHRVKNNMQLVSSLFNLHLKEIDNINAKNVLLESKNRLNSIAIVHELFYHCEKLSKIQISRYIKELIPILLKNHGLEHIIDVNYSINGVLLGLSRSVPLALVINEIIANATDDIDENRRNRKLNITIKTEKGSFILKIESESGEVNKTKINPNQNSFGFYLISLLVEKQLEGKLEMGEDDEVKLKIEFPI